MDSKAVVRQQRWEEISMSTMASLESLRDEMCGLYDALAFLSKPRPPTKSDEEGENVAKSAEPVCGLNHRLMEIRKMVLAIQNNLKAFIEGLDL